jgi:lipoprotein-releasing system ATP-binding protein
LFVEPGVDQKSVAPVLSARGIERSLGEGSARVDVLRGVDLDLRPASTTAIVGPSGCGKSTLLYLLGLLDRPDAGTLHIEGREVAGVDDAERTRTRNTSIGFVFQFHFLLAEFRAWENVALPMRKLGTRTAAEIRERSCHLLERVGLGDKTERLASALSGGEQQRVAVARALANEPSLILADEPTGNLDVANSDQVFRLLRETAQSPGGPAICLVTHNEALAASCDETKPMSDGRFR